MSGLARLIEAASIILVAVVLVSLSVTLFVAVRWGRSMLGRWARFRESRWVQSEIRSMRSRRLSELSPGPDWVHVVGTVQAVVATSSPSGKTCVAYRRGPDSGFAPFVLRTDDGPVWVQAELTSLQGHLEEEALLRHGDVVVVQGRVAELMRRDPMQLAPAEVRLMLTDDLGRPLQMLLPNEQVEGRSALLALWGRTVAGVLLLPLVFFVLSFGSCLGIAYMVAPTPQPSIEQPHR